MMNEYPLPLTLTFINVVMLKRLKGPRAVNVYPHKDPLVGMGVTLIAGGSVSDLRPCWLKHLCPQVVEFLFPTQPALDP